MSPRNKSLSTKNKKKSVNSVPQGNALTIEPPTYGPISHRIGQPSYAYHPHLIRETELTPGIDRNEFEQR